MAISTASGNQQSPQLASDGGSGAIIAWQDYRSGSEWDIYAQRVNLAEPNIIGGVVASDNAYVDVTFNEGVYNTSGGIGAVEDADFTIIFTRNGGSATNAVISSVTKTDGNPLTGGETVIRCVLNITGVPYGVETVEIKPAANSIYNVNGVVARVTETTGALTLNPLYGDADNDGDVDAADITYIEHLVAMDAGYSVYPGTDANQDGNVNALDITKTELLVT